MEELLVLFSSAPATLLIPFYNSLTALPYIAIQDLTNCIVLNMNCGKHERIIMICLQSSADMVIPSEHGLGIV
jgi:hypothetical protein